MFFKLPKIMGSIVWIYDVAKYYLLQAELKQNNHNILTLHESKKRVDAHVLLIITSFLQ